MDDADRLLEVGVVGKAHGLKGDVIVRLVTNRLERLAVGSRLVTDSAELVVAQSKPYQQHHLVRFEGVYDRSGAELLRGAVLRATPLEDEDELWVHELVGASVVDATGVTRGVVEAVQANPASDLLVLDTGHLVPLLFVTSLHDGVVEVDTPDGLFDLGS